MGFRSFCAAGILLLAMGQVSCSSKKGPEIKDKVPLTPVTGRVVVDGEPVAGVIVMCDPKGPIPETRPQYILNMKVMTAKDGSFKLQTYAPGDGLPVGEYSLAFSLLEQTRSGEKQLLAPEFRDRKAPVKTFTVEKGTALDLGVIELKLAAINK